MGFVGNVKARNLEARLDPFEIYDELSIDSEPKVHFSPVRAPSQAGQSTRSQLVSQNEKNSKKTGSQTKGTRRWSLVSIFSNRIMAVIFLLLTAISIYVSKPWSYFVQPDLVYAYFEVRAVDADGRPIAGALVKNSGKRVGTTDSFGEWRRYMRVPLGGTVPISLAKKVNDQILFVTKNFAIPPFKPEKSEIELRSSVQLLPSANSSIADDVNTQVTREDNGDLIKAHRNSSLNATGELSQNSFKSVIVDANATSSLPGRSGDNIHSFKSDHDAVWFEVSSNERGSLAKEVLPALVQRAKEVGLRVDRNAAWTVRLTNLLDKPTRVAKDGGGLILVTSMNRERASTETVEFLRNYQADARGTARGVLFGLVNHVNKNVRLMKTGDRWAAVLPKKSAVIWQLTAQQALRSGDRQIPLSNESFSDASFSGYYLGKSSVPSCNDSASECIAETNSFIHVAPVANWVKLRLKYPMATKSSSSIFVAGYPAKSVGDDTFEYWGQDKGRANVTVVENGRIVVRGSVVNTARGVATFSGQNLTRR
jgi:hypothetical protein